MENWRLLGIAGLITCCLLTFHSSSGRRESLGATQLSHVVSKLNINEPAWFASSVFSVPLQLVLMLDPVAGPLADLPTALTEPSWVIRRIQYRKPRDDGLVQAVPSSPPNA